jgi:hypothetical protein
MSNDEYECFIQHTKRTNSVALVHKRTTQTERPPLVGEVSANFRGQRYRVVSPTDPRGRIISFLDQSYNTRVSFTAA